MAVNRSDGEHNINHQGTQCALLVIITLAVFEILTLNHKFVACESNAKSEMNEYTSRQIRGIHKGQEQPLCSYIHSMNEIKEPWLSGNSAKM